MAPVASSSSLECEGLTSQAGIFLPVYPGHQAASQAAPGESTQIAPNSLTTPAFMSDRSFACFPHSVISHCMNTSSLFIHSTVDGHLDYLQFGTITILVWTFFKKKPCVFVHMCVSFSRL